jgi:hypothetical protein
MTMMSPVSFYWCPVHRMFHANVPRDALRRLRVRCCPQTCCFATAAATSAVDNSTAGDDTSSSEVGVTAIDVRFR